MPRPKFLRCIMTPGIIHDIRQRQDYYDKDPERAEREQQARKEQREQEYTEERMMEQEEFDEMRERTGRG